MNYAIITMNLVIKTMSEKTRLTYTTQKKTAPLPNVQSLTSFIQVNYSDLTFLC
jgi:hypothetical protein